MNLRDIAEVACVMSWYGTHRDDSKIDRNSLGDYQRYFRFRDHLWARTLNSITSQPLKVRVDLLEEILVSELLTRVVAATLMLRSQSNSRHRSAFEQIARSTVAQHQKMKHHFIAINRDEAIPITEQLRQQRLQRRLERWSDVLVNAVAGASADAELIFHPARCRETPMNTTASPLHDENGGLCLYANALKSVVPNRVLQPHTTIAVHRLLAESSLTLIPSRIFGRQGRVKPRLHRLMDSSFPLECRPQSTGIR